MPERVTMIRESRKAKTGKIEPMYQADIIPITYKYQYCAFIEINLQI